MSYTVTDAMRRPTKCVIVTKYGDTKCHNSTTEKVKSFVFNKLVWQGSCYVTMRHRKKDRGSNRKSRWQAQGTRLLTAYRLGYWINRGTLERA